MKPLFFSFLFFWAQFASAQKVVINDNTNALDFFKLAGGVPIANIKFTKLVEGSQYFKNDWMKGVIVMSEGWQYPNILVKLNLVDNEIIYKDKNGNELIANSPIKRVILTDTISRETYIFLNSRFVLNNGNDANVWYQVLFEGNASVLKQANKILKENIPYGTGLIEQTITDNPKYFILYDNKLTHVKKVSDVAAILPDKKNDLLKYISDKKITGKGESNFVEIVHYYNSLSK